MARNQDGQESRWPGIKIARNQDCQESRLPGITTRSVVQLNEKTFADFVNKGSFVLEKGKLVFRPIPSWLR